MTTAPHHDVDSTADLRKFREFLTHGAAGHAYAILLGIHVYDLAKLLQHVQRGFSFSALEHFQRNIGWPWDDVLDWLQMSLRTLTRRRQQGRLTPDESDRLLRAARIFGSAVGLFEGDAAGAADWLSKPLWALGGATPVDYAKTEVGAREVENVILRLEDGIVT